MGNGGYETGTWQAAVRNLTLFGSARGLARALREMPERAHPDEARDGDGVTPLMLASWYAKPDSFETLLVAGANPLRRDNYGRSAQLFGLEVRGGGGKRARSAGAQLLELYASDPERPAPECYRLTLRLRGRCKPATLAGVRQQAEGRVSIAAGYHIKWGDGSSSAVEGRVWLRGDELYEACRAVRGLFEAMPLAREFYFEDSRKVKHD